MIIKQRLCNLEEPAQEYGLNIQVNHVPSMKNKADVLSRVKNSWLSSMQDNNHM